MNRIIDPHSLDEMKRILQGADVSSQGVENMAPKAFALPVRLTGVELGAANIIKQEMLTVGGDAAIARGIVEGERRESDVILLGTVDKVRKVIRKLSHYTTFGIPQIRNDLENLLRAHLNNYRHKLLCRDKELTLDRMKVAGILNVTPDSFSDGGVYYNRDRAVERGLEMYAQGAEIIDIGGESSRPGAEPISTREEMERIIPVIEGLRAGSGDIIISVDTCKGEVAKRALEAGADMINDISALMFDEGMTEVLLQYPGVPVILMHMQGTPADMQNNPHYDNVVDEILEFLEGRIEHCLRAGIEKERILIDPGIGFGKTARHNLEIIRRGGEFHTLGVPVVFGASRKRFIDKMYSAAPQERLQGSLAVTAALFRSKINLIRVHDVKEHIELLKSLESIFPERETT